jgi:steroid delta-isomerase-like uncharacterized protein
MATSNARRARIGRLEIDERSVRRLLVTEELHAPEHGHARRQGMSNVIAGITTKVLEDFADAWNRHDVDALMAFMSDDCVFEASSGPEICGARYAGREAVRAGFSEVWTTFPDAHWGNARHFVHGDRGVSEWTFTGTRMDGTRVEVKGCDLFTFRDGKIALKNSYRKNRPSP